MTAQWWQSVNGRALAQGDLLPNCLLPVFVAPKATDDLDDAQLISGISSVFRSTIWKITLLRLAFAGDLDLLFLSTIRRRSHASLCGSVFHPESLNSPDVIDNEAKCR